MRYIDAEQIVSKLFSVTITTDLYGQGMSAGIDQALRIIKEQPTADVAEVKHGEWICLEAEIGYFACSECDHRILRAECNYCPNCGAKMDGGKKN